MPSLDAKSVVCAIANDAASPFGMFVRTNPVGACCVVTPIGELCLLVVPNRSEIEVSFADETVEPKFRYPLWAVQAALGHEAHAITYDSSTGRGVSTAEVLIRDFIKAAAQTPGELRTNIVSAYEATMKESAVQENRRTAERLWRAGDFAGAAELYGQMSSLTDLERKRLQLAKTHPTSRNV
jgi:hypothetical protein